MPRTVDPLVRTGRHLARRRRSWQPDTLVLVGLLPVALLLDLVVAPPEQVQGEVQRLMYVHVPSAWTAFLCFGVVALASAAVLLGLGRRWHAVAGAAAEVGVATTGLTLLEGSLWGQSTWGTWWTWDPRLVSTALLLVLYLAYLAMRRLPGPRRQVRRQAAWAGVLFVPQLAVVHFSVLWFRSLHQPPTILQPGPAPIEPLMLVALATSLVASSVAALWYVRRRSAQLLALDAGRVARAEAAAPPLVPDVAAPAALEVAP